MTAPLSVMSVIDRAFMGGKLAPKLQIMRLLTRLGERGDPGPANALLGVPTTTVENGSALRERPATNRGHGVALRGHR